MAETEQVRVTFQDDDSAAQIAAKLVDALDAAFSRATNRLGDRLEKPFRDMAASAKRAERSTSDLFRSVEADIRRATRSADAFKRTMDGIGATSRNTGGILDPRVFDAAGQSFNQLDRQAERLVDTFHQLVASGQGTDRTLENLTAALRSQANIASTTQQSLSRIANTEAKSRADLARVAQQRLTALEVAGSKERIVAAQQEGAQTLAATRAAAQRRLEIFRSVVGQIRALERGIGSLIGGGARAAGGLFGGLESAFSALVSRTRSSTQQINSSLRSTDSVLDRRTSVFRSAFRSQESVLRNSVTNQITQIQRLDSALSSGVAGALTGRSAAAGALGIGGVIGAGAGIFTVLRNGLTAGADFVQGLAVLDAQLQLTDEQMASVRRTALNLGNDIKLPGVSALDAAEAVSLLSKQFGSLGAQAAPTAEAAAKGVLQLARATKSSAEDAAQVVGAAVNVFGIEANKATEVADQVAGALSKAAGTSFVDFSAAFRQGATVFAQFQVPALGARDSLLEFNTALAALAQGGLIGSDAGTSLRSFFLQANRGTDDANAALREISERAGATGTAFFDAEGNARGLGDTLQILRDGLSGLSDQERSARLFTIFGTDAIRAAEILTGITGPAFDALREQLRREGVAAELAAAQNKGLRGALDALGSVVETQLILAYEKFSPVLGRVVLGFAELFNSVATGGGAFATLRTALKGIAAGLGGLLAVKLVAEGFGLLRVAIAGLLTPAGVLIAAAAGIGAAFFLLKERSEGFREILDSIKQSFTGFVNAFKANDPDVTSSGIPGFFERLGVNARLAFNYIGDVVIPTIARLARAFGGEVLERARAFADFITDTVVPAVRSGLTTAFETLVSTFRTVRNAVAEFLEPAADQIGRFVDALRSLVSEDLTRALAGVAATLAGVVGGFALGGPIGAIVGGLGGLVGGAFATGLNDELVDALGAIGGTIIAALRPLAGRVSAFLGDVFSLDNVLDVAFRGTELAQRLGRVLGSVVSDPRFVSAVAGIAGFAVLAAGRFVIGFGQGVIENIPELTALLREALEAALRAAIGFVVSYPGTFAALLTAAIVGRQALGIFRNAGTVAGQEVQAGFRRAFGGAFAGGGGVRGGAAGAFFTGLLGGPNALARSIRDQTFAAQREVDRMNTVLGQVGRAVGPSAGPRFGEQVRREFASLVGEIGPSGVLGLQLRSGLQATVNSVRSLSLAPVRQFFTDFGLTARQAMTAALRGAVNAAAGAFAGFQTGQALGGQGGLQQLLGVGGLALALGTINPVMGAAAGLAGALGVAFGNMGAKAEESKGRVLGLKDAILQANNAGELFTGIGAKLQADLEKSFDTGELEGLLTRGFDLGGLVERVSSQSTTLRKEFDRFATSAGTAGREFVATLGPSVDTVNELFLALSSPKGLKFAESMDEVGLEIGDVRDLLQFLQRSINETDQAFAAAGAARQFGADVAEGAAAAAPAVQELARGLGLLSAIEALQVVGETYKVEEAALAAQTALEQAGRAANDFLNGDYQNTVQEAIDSLVLDIPSVQADFADLSTKTGLALEAAQRAIQERIGEGLRAIVKADVEADVVAGRVPDPSDALSTLRQRLLDEIAADQAAGLPVEAKYAMVAQINELLNDPNLSADVAALAAVVAAALPSPVVPAPFTLDPKPTLDPQALADAIAGVISSSGSNPAGLRGAFGESRSGAGGQTIALPLTVDPRISLAPGGLAAAGAAGQTIVRVVAAAVVSSSGLLVAATSGSVLRSVAAMFAAGRSAQPAGIQLSTQFAQGIRAATGAAVAAAAAAGQRASAAVRTSTTAAYAAGVNISVGLARGIQAGAGAAISAARAVASAVISITKGALKISSPSRVFADIGRDIGRGLAQGIADSADDISNVARSVVDRLVNATSTRAGQVAAASASLFDLLQPQGQNGVTNSDAIRQRASLATLVSDLQGVFDQSAINLWEAVVAGGEGKQSAEQRAIAAQLSNQGIGFTTLDPGAILGAQNVEGFLNIAERIREFISTSVASGADITATTNAARAYADQLRAVSGQYGANAADVERLLASLGLSNSALEEFRRQVIDLQRGAANIVPPSTTPEPTAEQREREEEARRREEEDRQLMRELLRIATVEPRTVQVVPPYGDPEAIGLAVFNRVAVGLNVNT